MSVFVYALTSGAIQGLMWALLAIGVFITFRILNFADLTTEGSFALGGAVVSTLVTKNVEPFLATFIALFVGTVAGLSTGLLHTKLKVPPILAGILTMIALYSINIRIMGAANLPMHNSTTILTYLREALGLTRNMSNAIMAAVFLLLVVGALYWFFGTEKGSAIRATGSNELMCRAQGINTDNTKILALMLSNGIITLSGALVAQQQGYSNVGMGIGAIVIGLASVIIGETFMNQKFSFWLKLIFVALGSVLYRVIVTLVMLINVFEASDVRLLTAIIVIIALALPQIKSAVVKYLPFKNRTVNKSGTGGEDADN